MNWILKLTPVVAALVLTMACGDDDDDGGDGTAGTSGMNGGGDAGDPGTGGDVECTGTYTGMTADELAAETPDGACAGDTLAVCTNDISSIAGECGTDCFLAVEDPNEQLACTLECIEGDADPDPSQGCLGCYIAAVACARANCTDVCVGAAGSAECIDCRNENGCTTDFFVCSGLPVPGSN